MIKTYPEYLSKKYNNLKHVIKKSENDKHIIKIKNYEKGSNFSYILGPCSVENYDMLLETAKLLKKLNTPFLRAGAYKLRTSPYDFSGLEKKGVDIIYDVCKKNNIISFSEVPSVEAIEYMKDKVDVLVVGARNMQNIHLLKALAKVDNPIMLKRGPGATIMEFLLSAEYLIELGNKNVILCERGIQTFENYNRYTLDIAGACALLNISRLPVIIDPSHATGKRELIGSLSKASIAAGADGLIIESHLNPENAWSDSVQTVDLSHLKCTIDYIRG